MDNERTAVITIGDEEYTLLLTTKATKEIAGRYGGLENLGEKLMKSENFEMAIGEIVWLITLLANQSILVHNLKDKEHPKELLTEDVVELLTTPLDLAGYKTAITEALYKGTKRNVESEKDAKKRASRVTVSDAELFTRLLYYGLAHLHLSQDEVWLMPFGLLLDLWECHKQYNGQAIPAHEHYIDDIIPDGI